MSKPLGCWCLWCGASVKQEAMGFHCWQHGAVAAIGRCAVNAPAPWSKRQGYWDKAPAYEPLRQQQAPVLDAPLLETPAATDGWQQIELPMEEGA